MKITINAKDIEGVARGLENIDTRLGTALRKSNAEFGAYMSYSATLELGSTTQYNASRPPHIRKAAADARRKAQGIKLKGVATVVRTATQTTVTMRARPHILPAVNNKRANIVRVLLNHSLVLLRTAYVGHNANFDQLVSKAWIAALNDAPAREARALANQQAVYEFGFHRRSIYGYSPRRSDGAIRSEQNKELAKRQTKVKA